MLTTDELEILILSWQESHGEEKRSHNGISYYDMKHVDMVQAFMNLIQTLMDLGYEENEFNSVQLWNTVIKCMVSEVTKKPVEQANLKKFLERQWRYAKSKMFRRPQSEANDTSIVRKIDTKNKKRELMPTNDIIERPALDKSKIKGLVMPVIIMSDEDPLEFLKKERK